MLNIVIIPDAFKGSLSSTEVCEAIEQGFSHALPKAQIQCIPMADGGEGTLECLQAQQLIQCESTTVSNPIRESIEAKIGFFDDKTAIVEMAQASGLTLLPNEKRDPFQTSSFGTGELIRYALEKGSQRIIVGLGGSATCDAGIGALSALGIRFIDRMGEEVPLCAKGLASIASIDTAQRDPRLERTELLIAHDVNNCLVGLEGAIVYAAQKGATPKQVESLHKYYEQYSDCLTDLTGSALGQLPGTGAGGGLAASLKALTNATLQPGADWLIKTLKLRDKIASADLIITGEGEINSQTIQGKVPCAIAQLAKEYNIPVIGIAARLGKGYYETFEQGIDAVFSIANGPISEQASMIYAKPLLSALSNNIARLLTIWTQS